jgi:putative transcriptional regulator
MAIKVNLAKIMADRDISLLVLSKKVGITNVNLSKLKTGKVSAVRFSTLDALCQALDCQPGDILEHVPEK